MWSGGSHCDLGYLLALVLRGESLLIFWSDAKCLWVGWLAGGILTGGPGDCTR